MLTKVAQWLSVLFVVAVVGTNTASAQFYFNGPLDTGPTTESGVAAPAGTTWSEVQHDAGNMAESNTLSGVSCSVTSTVFRCADDFTVPGGSPGWTITSINVYAYQTGYAGAGSPITAGTLQIWNQPPNNASPVCSAATRSPTCS